MAEQKAKPAVKKIVSGKATNSTTAAKPKTAKVAAAKKVATKKSAAPAVKKTAASATKNKAPVKKAVTTSPKPVTKKPATEKIPTKPTPEERYRMVQTAAYFIAERNGFCGCSTGHWVSAEIEIARMLGQ